MSKWLAALLVAVLLSSALPTGAATAIFQDGFESGNLSAWNNCPAGSPVINQVQSTTKRAGTYALKHDLKNSSGANYSPCIHSPVPAPTGLRHYVSFWVNWGSTYACRNHWWRWRFSDGGQLDVSHDFSPCRAPGYYDVPEFLSSIGGTDAGWVIADPFVTAASTTNPFNPVLSPGWHRVEMLLYLNTPSVADGTVKLWYDGVAYVDTNNSPTIYELQPSRGTPKKPRGSSSSNLDALEIMTNADIIGYFDCGTRGGVQPCHDGTLDYFLYIDDVLWADGCPDTGATCSSETSISQGKTIRLYDAVIGTILALLFAWKWPTLLSMARQCTNHFKAARLPHQNEGGSMRHILLTALVLLRSV